MGAAPIVDAQWRDGGVTTPPAPGPGTTGSDTRADGADGGPGLPAVAPDAVRLGVPVVWVATLAEQEARELSHHRLGTEHLLLALVRLGDATGRRLIAHGATLALVRRALEVDAAPGAMDNANGRPGWSTAASGAVRAARVTAGREGRREVSSDDLLTAMLGPGTRASAVLLDLGVDPDAVAAVPSPARRPRAEVPPQGSPRREGVVATPSGTDAAAEPQVA